MVSSKKSNIITFPSNKSFSFPHIPKLPPKQMKKFMQNLPASINFNTKFFSRFFSDNSNRDLLLRFINSVLIDTYYLPLTKLVSETWVQGGADDTGNLTSGIGVGGITEEGDYNQLVLHPMENPLSPDSSISLYGGAYELFKEMSPKNYKKKSLHYVFLLNHLFEDPLDIEGLLKKDFHIINTPPDEYIPLYFPEGDLVVHFIQLPRLFTSKVKNSFLDLALFISLFINISFETKPDNTLREYYYDVDPDMRRILTAYDQYIKE